AKFVGDFKSLTKEADASLAKHKTLELEIERLLRAVLFKKVSDEKENTKDSSKNTKFAKQPIAEIFPKIGETNALSKPVTSNSVSTPQVSKGMNNAKVIASGMFRISPDKISKEAKHVLNTVSTSSRTKPITVSQPNVITKKNVNSDLNGLSSIGLDKTKTRRPQPRSNTKNDRDVISKVVCAKCKKFLIFVNHDKCVRNYVNGKNSRGKKQKTKVSFKEIQMKYWPKVSKPKNVGTHESLATPKPRKPRFLLRWSLTGKMFDPAGKLVAPSNSESHVDCSNGCSKHMTRNQKLLINFIWKFMGTVRFGNDHVAAILGFGDLQRGNILIIRVYFVEGLSHNLFSVGQFCDSDLEVAFRRNDCFVKNLEGVDLLKGDRLPKFKYHKEHLCPSCEQGKSKRASHPPKPVPNSRQRLHLLHMDLCGPMRIASINGKRYILAIVDDYSRYTWVHFLRSKDEAP
nr:hypothetical protein [Tanacetum cinerariifolium]